MKYRDIDPAGVADLRAELAPLILDTRDPASRARGHIEGSEPADEAMMQRLLRERRGDRPILVYCYRGNSSRNLCELIAGFGYSRVYNLAGGWQAWERFIKVAQAPSPGLSAWMVERGFNPGDLRARIDNGMSALMVAALQGETAWVEELLNLGADPNHVNDDDHHALWFACVNGDAALVARLISVGGNVDNQNVNGATCAIYAASTGKLEVLRRLVEAGADLEKETTGGYNALDSASTLPVLKYLRAVTEARRVA